MHACYSTVSAGKMTQAVAKVIDLAAFRQAHMTPASLTAALTT